MVSFGSPLPLLLISLLIGTPALALDEPAQAVRMAAEVFGTTAEIEVRDLPRAAAVAAIEQALSEIHTIGLLTDPEGSTENGLGRLNRAPSAVILDPRAFQVLIVGLRFCLWSGGAYSPLGLDVYRLWQKPVEGTPNPTDLRDTIARAGCSQIRLQEGKEPQASLSGGRASTVGIERGFAADRAMDLLRLNGASNALVVIGNVYRAIGLGVEGKGWLVDIPGVAPGLLLDQVWLLDQSMAIVRADLRPERPLDLRTGVPARSNLQVVTVADLAADAEGLASTLFVMGMAEGQRRLGQLQPRPSVYWLIGGERGTPLEASYRWNEIAHLRSGQ